MVCCRCCFLNNCRRGYQFVDTYVYVKRWADEIGFCGKLLELIRNWCGIGYSPTILRHCHQLLNTALVKYVMGNDPLMDISFPCTAPRCRGSKTKSSEVERCQMEEKTRWLHRVRNHLISLQTMVPDSYEVCKLLIIVF